MTIKGYSEDKLNILIEQVGRFTEGLTEFRLSMERAHQEFNQKLDRITETAERQCKTARLQSESVSRLIALLEQR